MPDGQTPADAVQATISDSAAIRRHMAMGL